MIVTPCKDVIPISRRPPRSTAPGEQTWDLESLFPSNQVWEAEYERVQNRLSELAHFQGRLGESAETLLACLRLRDELGQQAFQVAFFGFNRVSEDQTDQVRQGLASRARILWSQTETAGSFIRPELLSLPDGTVETFVESCRDLRLYRHHLYDVLEQKEHMLGSEAEAVLATLGEVLQSPYEAFNNAVNADAAFEPVTDSEGETLPVTVATVGSLLESQERDVRRAAYLSLRKGLDSYKRTLASTHSAAQRRDALVARLRRYPSSLAAALAEAHLPLELFHNLIRVANEGSQHFRRYTELRQARLGLDRLMPWDLLAPLEPTARAEVSFHEAMELIATALAPLGPEYAAVLEQARRGRWIDWADNDGKQAGAYSWGCYGFHPIILMNWTGRVTDLFTLAHELGHTVHSVMTTRNQPYIYGHYTSFLAEMASTANEILLARHLLDRWTEPALRRLVLEQNIRSFQGNFWGASAVAEHQLVCHEMAEQGRPLTYEAVTEAYVEIMQRRYGGTVEVTPEGIGSAWLQVLHNYRNFYSYQYATGISAGAAFADAILTEGEPAVQRYLRFLSAGSSAYDIEILLEAGLDFRTPAPMERAVALYAGLVDELDRN